MIVLRPYQRDAKAGLYDALRQHRSVVWVMPTGAGKRICAVDVCLDGLRKGRRILVVTNRRLLVDQMARECRGQDIHYGVIMADYYEGDPGGPLQIASLQSLFAWYLKKDRITGRLERTGGLPQADLIMVDECFTGPTRIKTVRGEVRIDQVRPGDVVYGASGLGTVESTFCKKSDDLYRLELSDGSTIECTGSHPFFTTRGWIEARNLEGEDALGPEAVRFLWESVPTLEEVRRQREGGQQPAGGELEQASLLLAVLCQEIQEPHEQPPDQAQGKSQTQGVKAQTNQERRERAIAAFGAAGPAARPGRRVGGRASSAHKDVPIHHRLPDLLQDRPGQQRTDAGDRVRRGEPQRPLQEGSGRQKNGLPGTARVVSVSCLEREGAKPVFNLRVSGHPSYFANGRLVHNCHQDIRRYSKLFEYYPDAKIVGMTATPVGAKGRSLTPDTYETLVEGVKNTALVAAGWLLPTRVFAPSEPNMQGVEVQGGQEFNQSQLSRNVEECTCFADVLREWTPFADRKTVAFVPGIKFGRDLERLFNEHLGSGKAHLIHAKTRQAERDRILQHVAEGDGQVLISVDILKEGFDLPELSCGIDLQPNHQLRSYWQKVGRTKRPFGDQTNAVWLDFAGNYWRFPHPNDDPTWPEGDETTQEVIERERAEGKGNQPISCPACHEVYTPCGKPVCPHCGHEIQGTPVRRIRMGDGRLIEVPAMTKRKVEKTDEQRLQDQWKSALIGGIKANRTFGQCAYLYRQSTGKSPQQSWPGVFERGSLHWKRKVHQDLNLRELLRRFEEIRQ